MARPKDADSEQTIALIIGAALEVMGESGSLKAPALRAVAAKAGVGLGTIQYYFGTKEEVLEACLDGYYERLSALGVELIEHSKHAPDSRSFIERSVGMLYDFSYRERAMLALRIATNADRGQLHPRRQPEYMGALAKHAAKAMLPYIQTDERDARMSVQAVTSMIVRFVLMSDSELTHLTDLQGPEAREEARAYVVRSARRLVRPGDG